MGGGGGGGHHECRELGLVAIAVTTLCKECLDADAIDWRLNRKL
jgi:hypothetical protein